MSRTSTPTIRLSLLALSLLVAGATFAATFIVPPDADMVQRADAIAVGTAFNSFTRLNAHGGIETVTHLTIQERIKGIAAGAIDIVEPGGAYGDRATIIPGVPRFADGERVLVFLTRTPQGTWAVTDIALGKFSFASDAAGHKLLVRSEGEINGWDTEGNAYVEKRRDAERFLQFVRTEAIGGQGDPNYNVPKSTLRFDDVQVSNTPTRIAVTATPTSYTSDLGDGRGGRWTAFPNAVNWLTQNGASTAAVAGVNAGIAAWDNDTCSNVNYVNAGPDSCNCHNSGLSGSDGANTVLFERNLTGYGAPAFSCSGNTYSGTLGIGGITIASGTHTGPNGESFWTTQEGDVEMNQGVLGCAAFMNSGDWPSAVAHELGHSLGFRHSDQTRANNPSIPCGSDPNLECSSSAIMRSSIPHGLAGNLQQYDINAVRAVYPATCSTPPPPTSKRVVDFNGDGHADIFWRNVANGQNSIWFMNGTTFTGVVASAVPDTNWDPAAFGDFNADGKSDILWRNHSTGATSIWLMNGGSFTTAAAGITVSDLNWHIVGAGDFDGDGRADIFWRNSTSGQDSIWFMNGTAITGVTAAAAAVGWEPVILANFDTDTKTDILWRNSSSGATSVWLMNGASFSTAAMGITVSDMTWQPVGAADFDNDGTFDIFWRNTSSGNDSIWFMNGTAITASGAPAAPAAWQPRVFGDFNTTNGNGDIFWWLSTTGDTSVWLMSGSSFTTAVSLGAVSDTNWQPVKSY